MKWKFGSKATREAARELEASSNLSRGLGATRPVGLRRFTDSGVARIRELLYQTLEAEIGGVRVYESAVRCAVNPQLAKEWRSYAEQTRRHEEVLLGLFRTWDMDPSASTAARTVLRQNLRGLAASIDQAFATAAPDVAQLVAAECVLLLQTKANLNWDMLGNVSSHVSGKMGDALKDACDEVEGQESEQLYHTTRWANQLWLAFLGRPPVIPPDSQADEPGGARANIARARGKRPDSDEGTGRPGRGISSRTNR